jgi:murein DD-endopeptidase MepM/ murein hydrolase activator NlpD
MGPVHRTYPVHLKRPAGAGIRAALAAGLVAVAAGACGSAPPEQQPRSPMQRALGTPPPLPDTTGWGIHVLTLSAGPGGTLWAGTNGDGIFVIRRGQREWHRIAPADTEGALAWGFVNSLAFGPDTLSVWYGTVGNGFGRSRDGGATWRNWTFSQLGPQWQYVAPHGIVTRGDSVYIATADGLRITWDDGASWRCVQARDAVAGGAPARADGCTERHHGLPSKYLLSLDVAGDGSIWAGHLLGLSISRDGGASWTDVESEGIAGRRVRAVRVHGDSAVWAATEDGIFVDSTMSGSFVPAPIRVPGIDRLPGAPRAIPVSPNMEAPVIATSYGLLARNLAGDYRIHYIASAERYRPAGDIWAVGWLGPAPPTPLEAASMRRQEMPQRRREQPVAVPLTPVAGTSAGLALVLAGTLPVGGIADPQPPAQPAEPRHTWLRRPIADQEGNPHVDAAYRYGSTMGGNFQQHQGVEFNNPAGTPVRAAADGTVVFAGQAESGSSTVVLRHERQWEGQHVFTTYYHNSSIDVTAGQRVAAGTVLGRVGNTGRATNEHLHFEVHVAPTEDLAAIMDPQVRFPPHTVNPQLWMEPLPGTGIVAGTVVNAAGEPVPGARVYGLVLPYPTETPFSFAETYGDRARGSPAYGEHFAVGDVPAGTYIVGVQVEGRRVWRRLRVAPGMVTWVELRP